MRRIDQKNSEEGKTAQYVNCLDALFGGNRAHDRLRNRLPAHSKNNPRLLPAILAPTRRQVNARERLFLHQESGFARLIDLNRSR